ncbi:MAG: hypothetical protein RSE41_03895 [Clostridia bacterium]
MLAILGEKLHWSKETCENCYFYELEQMIEVLSKKTEEENKRYKEQESKQTEMPSMPNMSVPNISMPNISMPRF